MENMARQFAGEGWQISGCTSFFVSRLYVAAFTNTCDRRFGTTIADCKGPGGVFGRVIPSNFL